MVAEGGGNGLRPRLLLDAQMDGPDTLPFAGGRLTLFSRRSPGREGLNQDAAAAVPLQGGGGVLAVADGVGGLPSGAEAAREALEALLEALARGERKGRAVRESILDGFDEANRRVTALGGGAGTTLVVAELAEGLVRSYHAGDSELLVTGQRGRLKHWTVAHSPTGYAVHSGMLDHREAMVHEQRHLVINTIGSADMHIDLGPGVPLCPRDTLLLATDGLFDNLALPRIVDLVRKGAQHEAVERLVSEARRHMKEQREDRPGKPDDLTVLVWRPLVKARRAEPASPAGGNGRTSRPRTPQR